LWFAVDFFFVAVVRCGLYFFVFTLLLEGIFVWCWCCSGLQLLVEGLCCLFVILFAFGELGVVLLLLCLSVVSSLNLLSLSVVLPLSEFVLVFGLASNELECQEALSSLWSLVLCFWCVWWCCN